MTDDDPAVADDADGGIVPPYMLDRIARRSEARSLRARAALARRSADVDRLSAIRWDHVADGLEARADDLDATLDRGSRLDDRD